MRYNGTTKLPGALYGGVTAPTDSIRLNYDGYFYATSMTAISFYGNGSGLTNLNATNLASGQVHSNRGTTATGSTNFSFLRFTAWTKTNGCFYGGAASTAPNNTTMLNYDGQFRATNLLATGAITAVAVSSFNGVQISSGAGTGISNVGVGANFLVSNTTGHTNVGIGVNCLFSNTSGYNNTAIGTSSLASNTSGRGIVSVGYDALYNNTGNYNTAVGMSALRENLGGIVNTAIGYNSGINITNTGNTSVGANSLRGITGGSYNTAIGYLAMGTTTTGSGSGNTAVGYVAGNNISSGNRNVCVGQEAGRYITSGTNNIIIGYIAGSFAGGPGGSITTQSNQIIMGNNSHTNAYIRVGFFVTSDERDKTNFGAVPHGLDFVNKLNPISFQNRISRDTDQGHGPFYYGFKAQEVLKLEGEKPVIIDVSNPEKLSLHDSSMIPVLVNAIKELTAEVNKLKQQKGEI